MTVAEKIYEHVKSLPEPAVLEILDFVEFIKMKRERSDGETSTPRIERSLRMRKARGLWKDRNDLPDFQAIRREWDRANGEES